MSPRRATARRRHHKFNLLNPVSDEQQMQINDQVDKACDLRMGLEPTDPRIIPYMRPILWLWK